jgi:beta-ureidopropionase / N-carbamoyl-L-amino-acid hydrolase
MAMIFVPSNDGVSHSPKEFTSWQDVSNGAEVLYRSILLLDGAIGQEVIAADTVTELKFSAGQKVYRAD